MADDSKIKQLERRRLDLDQEIQSFIPHYKEVTDYIYPRSARYLTDGKAKGNKAHNAIINSTATIALRTLKSGMHAGMTSPARPWFRFTTSDLDLMEWDPVKQWLYDVEERMRIIFARSNLYNAFPTMYGSLGGYGTAAMVILEDPITVLRAFTFPIGSYTIALDDSLRVDTLYRRFPMTVRQAVMMFARRDPKSGSERWEHISSRIKSAWDAAKYETQVEVIHAIEPNPEKDATKLEARHKPTRSVYYELGTNEDKLLRESGFDDFPGMCPRWDVFGEDDTYGYSPGMEALGDVKQLQLEEKRKAEALDKLVRPPMLADSSLRSQRTSILPGDVTYIDNLAAQQHAGFRPAYEVNPRVAEIMGDIRGIEQRIKRVFYEDLMLMFAQSDDPTMTAREVEERHQEKLLILGPILERLNCELLDPVIDRSFSIMLRKGLVPPPPKELEGQDLKVEYTSIMAQAQKLIGTANLERVMGFVGNLASIKQSPEVWDKINTDHAIEEYAKMHGVSPKIIIADDVAAQTRDDRNKANQAQQLAAMAPSMAQAATAAKTLSETDVTNTSALSRLITGV